MRKQSAVQIVKNFEYVSLIYSFIYHRKGEYHPNTRDVGMKYNSHTFRIAPSRIALWIRHEVFTAKMPIKCIKFLLEPEGQVSFSIFFEQHGGTLPYAVTPVLSEK